MRGSGKFLFFFFLGGGGGGGVLLFSICFVVLLFSHQRISQRAVRTRSRGDWTQILGPIASRGCQ